MLDRERNMAERERSLAERERAMAERERSLAERERDLFQSSNLKPQIAPTPPPPPPTIDDIGNNVPKALMIAATYGGQYATDLVAKCVDIVNAYESNAAVVGTLPYKADTVFYSDDGTKVAEYAYST